jgi:hypothetical protein
MPRMSLVIVVLALVAAAMVGAAVGAAIAANRSTAQTVAVTTPVKHHTATPPGAIAAKPRAPMARYRQLVANLAVAEDQGDYRDQAVFRAQLDSLLTPQLIGQIYQERERLLGARAATPHDSHNGLMTRRLMALCGSDAVKARITFCK